MVLGIQGNMEVIWMGSGCVICMVWGVEMLVRG